MPDTSAIVIVQLAELVRSISHKYIADAALAYPVSNPPVCDIVVFGYSGFNGELAAYRIGLDISAQTFSQQVHAVDLSPGVTTVLGTDAQNLKDEIKALEERRKPEQMGMAPKIALASRIAAATHSTVGGSLQCAVMSYGGLETFTAEVGIGQRTILGFGLAAEIEPILGCPVLTRELF